MILELSIACALALGAQSPAPSSSPSSSSTTQADVERLFAEGAALYKGGKYREAIDKFEEAYALYPEPNLLYNTARAYEALGEIDGAITKYRLSANHPRAGDELKAKANAKLAVLQSARDKGAEPSSSPAAPSSTPSPPSTSPPASPPPSPAPASAGFPMWGVAGGVAAGVGALTAAGGGVVFGLGAATHSQLERDLEPDANGVTQVTRREAEDALDAGTTQKTAGVALLATGGVLVAAAVPLFVLQFAGE